MPIPWYLLHHYYSLQMWIGDSIWICRLSDVNLSLFHLSISNFQAPDHKRVFLLLWALFKTRPSNSPMLCRENFFFDVKRIVFVYVHYIQLFMYLQILKKNIFNLIGGLNGTYLHSCTWLFNSYGVIAAFALRAILLCSCFRYLLIIILKNLTNLPFALPL